MTKIVLLEGRTDMFYLKKAYELVGHDDDTLYIPCGGASEIWPVIEGFKWKYKGDLTIEVWVDNDDAGLETKRIVNTAYPEIRVRIVGHVTNRHTSMEDIFGFLAPKQYEKYTKAEKKKELGCHTKWAKSEFRDAKHELFDSIMKVRETHEENIEKVKEALRSFDIDLSLV